MQSAASIPVRAMDRLRSGWPCAPAVAAMAMLLFPFGAAADDTLKLAIGQIDNWENQGPTLGQHAGIFKKHGIELQSYGTQGTGESMQAVISGSTDFGFGVGMAGAMRAYSKGAPIRVILPAFTGTGDLYWYVKVDSPIKSLSDTTSQNTIAYSASGSSSHNIVTAFVEELAVKARPTATGTPASTLTTVLSGQIDIGWAAPPFGLKEIQDGKIRIVGRGSDVPSLRDQTIRVTIVNAEMLKQRKDAVFRFVQAYREAVDWIYSDPQAITLYAQKIGSTVDLIKSSVAQFHPKQALQSDEIKDLDGLMSNAIKLKFLDAPLTKEQLADFIQIPPR